PELRHHATARRRTILPRRQYGVSIATTCGSPCWRIVLVEEHYAMSALSWKHNLKTKGEFTMSDGLVLVTGSSGRIGKAVVKELQTRGHRVRGFDRIATQELTDMVVGTLTSEADIARAMNGVHTVVHLAATPDDADFLAEIVPNNIIGVYHIFEHAQKAGVKRLIVASSGQVVWYQRMTGPLPIGVDVQ